MRRVLIAALAALFLWAPLASGAGRVAVISVPFPQETSLITAPVRADYQTSRNTLNQHVRAFLDAHAAPGNYDFVPVRAVQTSLVRHGLITGWNGDTAYAAVIWAGIGGAVSTNQTAGCYPCSLSITGMLPTTPQLFLGTALSEVGWANSTSCSLGAGDCQDPSSQGPDYSSARVFTSAAPTLPFGWTPGAQTSTLQDDKDSTIISSQSYLRVVMGSALSNLSTYESYGSERAANLRPAWRDSLNGAVDQRRLSGVTTAQYPPFAQALIWDRLNTYKADTTFAPIVVAQWLTTAIPTTGGDDSNDLRPTGNPFVVWAAIAHFDSISGFAVLGNSHRQRALAFQVSHGLKRGAWNAAGGLRPSDPNFSPAVDSLADLNIPFAVGLPAEADTLATYADDITTWRRAGRVKFALNPILGTVDTVVVGADNASAVKPFDLFGRYRSRVFYGSSTEDSTVYEMLVAAKARLDSLVGRDRVDKMLMAGDDDYSPVNWAHPDNCRDSLASVAALAGFSGIAINPEEDSLDVVTPTNPRGLSVDTQGWSRAEIGSAAGRNFLFAAYPGQNTRGAVYGHGSYVGGALLGDSAFVQVYSHRALHGLYLPYWQKDMKKDWVVNSRGMSAPWYGEPGYSYSSERSTRETGTNLVRVTASSLGYGGDGPSADMPGFYQIKYTVNMARTLNALAGRTLIRFVYPGELSVEDLRR